MPGTAAVLVAGCAGKMPQTAEAFRQMAPGGFMVQAQAVDEKRSPREIRETPARGARARAGARTLERLPAMNGEWR